MANFSSDSCLTMLSVGISRAIGIWTLKTWTLKLQKKKMMMKITKTMVPVVKTTRGGGDHERPRSASPMTTQTMITMPMVLATLPGHLR